MGLGQCALGHWVLYWSVLVHTGPYWSVLVYTGPYWSILVCTGPYWSVLVHTGPYGSVLVRTGPYWSVLVHTGLYWSILVHTGPYWSVPVPQPDGLVLQWEPLEQPWDPPGDTAAPPVAEEPPDPGYEPDWAVLSPPQRPPRPPGWRGGFRLALRELRGLRRGPPGLGPPFLLLLPRDGPCVPPLHFPRGGHRNLLRLLGPHLHPCPRDPRLLLVTPPQDPPQPPSPGLVTRLLQGPVGGLSRLLGGPRGHAPRQEGAELEAEPDFEVITCVRLGPRPAPPRGPPVTPEEWGRSFDSEGRSLDPQGLLLRIFRGGLSPELRPEGWRRLLGLRGWGDPPKPDGEQRSGYTRMQLQWRSLSPGQLRRNRLLSTYRRRLERDLGRCPPHGPPRALLRDVLMTHCMFHFDLGYVRGMGEVLAPLLGVTPLEHEAFWGFCSIMEMVGSSFGPGRAGMGRVVQPELGEDMGCRGVSRCCRRWLQLRFQPWLGTEGTRRVWEVLWTGLPCPNFHLLLVFVLLEVTRDVSPAHGDPPGAPPGDGDSDSDSDSDSDEVPAVPLDAERVLSAAEGLFLQLRGAPDLPPALRELLGMGSPPLAPPRTPGSPPRNLNGGGSFPPGRLGPLEGSPRTPGSPRPPPPPTPK
ncbi:TBC1 domain family member 17-like isoform X2 [Columba livia]|uniref:TBC1 domain family member 17-like isoform X2 n=1 Tax=Columba livia TaxID=8932 RepID=UPI0031BB1BB5